MPYIQQERRNEIRDEYAKTSGELNYLLTLECQRYLSLKDTSYEAYNAVLGALESCKLEFYRRVVVEYENKKIAENGDVY